MIAGYQESGGLPVRYPDTSSPVVMRRRAWLLVLLGALIPGSAQVLAGNRKLGRFALSMTILLWMLVLAALVTWWFWPAVLYSIPTQSLGLIAVQGVLVFYAGLWVVLALDTLRLVRLVKVRPFARGAVAMVAVALMAGTVGVAGYSAHLAGVTRTTIDKVFTGGVQYADPIDGRYNVLLLGGDAGPGREGLRPDSISVVSIDAETGHTTIIGVPRNLEQAPFSEGSPLYEHFPNGYDCGNECLISYLYTYGEAYPELYPRAQAEASQPGIEATRDAVEGALGMQLQYYVLIDMQGFSDLIDALGGVTIDVAETVPLGENGKPQKGEILAGTHVMDGATALDYVRARYNTTDYARMERQRQVQVAILEQFEPANVLSKFEAVADAGAQVVKTDIPQSMLGRFVELAGKARGQDPTRLELVPPLIDTVAPDYDLIHAMVDEALTVPSPSPTPSAG